MPASGTSQTASVLILTITDETPQTRIVLQTPAQRMTELRRIDSQLLRGAVQAVSRALQRGWQRNGGQPGDLKRLRAEGEKLAELIFPNHELSSALTSWDGCFLRIEAPLNWQVVPWELLVLDGQFLCQRTAIGRIVPGLNETARSEFDTIGSPRLVSIPDTSLIAAQREYDAVRRHLRQLAARHPARFQRPECSYMKQTAADMARCLDGSRWFHFSGHSQSVGETRGWRLAQSGPMPSKTADLPHHLLMPEQLCDLPVGHWPELVVAHACGSAQMTAAPDGPPSMVEAMLRQGVSWYLGTLAPVLDDQCLKFVEPFYSSLTSGVPIGTALHRARTAMREQLPEGNLLWLSYVLYGDPTVDLTTGRDFGPGQSEAPTATFDPLRQPD
ncbi:MAG: CHAT domain-containing protein, partial [Planctomycetota bacterium]|nr:CHAT domain-containing protein [Planctomycetota bacterium]